MTLDTNITKIGDSLYVLIPSFIARQYDLKNGDTLEMSIKDDEVTITIKRKEDAVR